MVKTLTYSSMWNTCPLLALVLNLLVIILVISLCRLVGNLEDKRLRLTILFVGTALVLLMLVLTLSPVFYIIIE